MPLALSWLQISMPQHCAQTFLSSVASQAFSLFAQFPVQTQLGQSAMFSDEEHMFESDGSVSGDNDESSDVECLCWRGVVGFGCDGLTS